MIATAALHDALEVRVQVDAIQKVENLPGKSLSFAPVSSP
jgi:hypothetical protein